MYVHPVRVCAPRARCVCGCVTCHVRTNVRPHTVTQERYTVDPFGACVYNIEHAHRCMHIFTPSYERDRASFTQRNVPTQVLLAAHERGVTCRVMRVCACLCVCVCVWLCVRVCVVTNPRAHLYMCLHTVTYKRDASRSAFADLAPPSSVTLASRKKFFKIYPAPPCHA